MINSASSPQPFANVVAPFNPAGKLAVGEESADAKNDLLPPVEEAPSGLGVARRDVDESTVNDSNTDVRESLEGSVLEQRGSSNSQEVDEEILAEIRELSRRDTEVRAHERAHSSVGGQYTGAASYGYKTGPDGVRYAVGGEVSITLPSLNGDPEQAIRAAEQVRRAALAPAEPSEQDRRVAASASQVIIQARAEAQRQQQEAERLERVELNEAEKARELEQAKRESRIESLRQNSTLNSQLSTAANLASPTAGQLLDQTA